MLSTTFNLQGHRGARGLRPGNTLPSFEAALDAGVTSIETDLHLSRDGHPVITHDPVIGRLVSTMTAQELAATLHASPDEAARLSQTLASASPLTAAFAQRQLVNPLAVPTLDFLFEFVAAYAGELGEKLGKSAMLRARADRLVFDLELKRVPGKPECIGDGFNGISAARLEESALDSIRRHGALNRTVVRSFDHRCVKAMKELEPALHTAVLVGGTAPVAPEDLVRRAGASVYCPEISFLDEIQVKRLHADGIAVIPWTVNGPEEWDRLLSWGVDGITTDYPDRLAATLALRGIPF